MRIECYTREYCYNEADGDYGLYFSNDRHHLGGDANLPGFKPYDIDPSYVEKILQMTEVQFGALDEKSPEYRYVIHGLRQLLLGQKSDWKITLIEPLPGRICLYVRNRKIIKASDLLSNLDIGKKIDPDEQIAILDLCNNNLSGWTIINILPRDEEYCRLKLRLKRKDLKGEVDFYDMVVGRKTAEIREFHRISRARREISLRFSDKVDKYGDAEAMIGEIEETE